MSDGHKEFQQRLKRINSGSGLVAGTTLIGQGSVKDTQAKVVVGSLGPRPKLSPLKLAGALFIGAGSVLAGQKIAIAILAGSTPIPVEIITKVTNAVSEPQIALGAAALIAVTARIFLRLETKLQTLALVASFCMMAFQPQLVFQFSDQVVALLVDQGILPS